MFHLYFEPLKHIQSFDTIYTFSKFLLFGGFLCFFLGSIFYLKVYWSTLWQGIFDRCVQGRSIGVMMDYIIHVSFFLLIFVVFQT